MSVKSQQPCHRAIQELAYILWQLRGRPNGDPEVDWYRAERELGDAFRFDPLSSFESTVIHDTGSTQRRIAFVKQNCP